MRRALKIIAAGCTMALGACSGQSEQAARTHTAAPAADTVPVQPAPPSEPEPEAVHFADTASFHEYIARSDSAAQYAEGIIPDIARHHLPYADSLVNDTTGNFIIVDKGGMKLRLYDRYGREQRKYGIACAKAYGAKRSRTDGRTPEGFFRVKGIYDSTDWLFTNDDGVTSPVKGQYGPRFIRIVPRIGIHGTGAPWSIGHRTSHGCIRVLNDNILELVDLVGPNTPVIIIPGPRDLAANHADSLAAEAARLVALQPDTTQSDGSPSAVKGGASPAVKKLPARVYPSPWVPPYKGARRPKPYNPQPAPATPAEATDTIPTPNSLPTGTTAIVSSPETGPDTIQIAP